MPSFRRTIDTTKANRMLAGGASVREAALACGVSTQAMYAAIKNGRVTAPEAPAGSAA